MIESALFYDQIRNVDKILVLDLGFLGDAIQLIPSLKCIRDAMPNVQLDVMIAEHVTQLLELTPWVDHVWGYPRFPKGPKWYEDFGRVRQLRKAKYPVVINLNGSDRSSILTKLSGARYRLGRLPSKINPVWKRCFTHRVSYPYGKEPVYLQRWHCLKQLGFPGNAPEFGAVIPEDIQQEISKLTDQNNNYIHISPFTTQDYKELPASVIADFMDAIHHDFPDLKIAVSCAPNEREKNKLESLLKMLKGPEPWRVFPGNLSILELATLIANSKVHLGGDSGAIHLAQLVGCKTVSWWRDYDCRFEWMPQGPGHFAAIGKETDHFISNVSCDDLLEQFRLCLI